MRARGNDRSFLAMDDVREVIVFACACFDRERDSGVPKDIVCVFFFLHGFTAFACLLSLLLLLV